MRRNALRFYIFHPMQQKNIRKSTDKFCRFTPKLFIYATFTAVARYIVL
ncbi:MAG: hypothetical protein K6G73_05440 [Marinilabiliaceae bacterium]|nr:hypothetical protein [Marinilabiliaceae bacterium]